MGNRDCSIYIGNLDERVNDRVLYEILIQAGRVIDLHVARDKETNQHKGFAFAEYESVEIADYAVRLFSGFVTLYNRKLKFGLSGQQQSPSPKNMSPPTIPKPMPSSYTKAPSFQPHRIHSSSHQPCRFSAYPSNSNHRRVSNFSSNTYAP